MNLVSLKSAVGRLFPDFGPNKQREIERLVIRGHTIFDTQVASLFKNSVSVDSSF